MYTAHTNLGGWGWKNIILFFFFLTNIQKQKTNLPDYHGEHLSNIIS